MSVYDVNGKPDVKDDRSTTGAKDGPATDDARGERPGQEAPPTNILAGARPWIAGGALALLALVGLFITSRSHNGPEIGFGALLAVIGVGGIFWMVGKATAHD